MKNNLMPKLGTLDSALICDLLDAMPRLHSLGNPNPNKDSGRKVEVFALPGAHPIYEAVYDLCQDYADDTGIQFDALEEMSIMRYGPNDGYRPHTDFSVNDDEYFRKISFVALLNEDYVGGELVLTIGNKALKVPKQAGAYVLFPSFLMHEVRPVISGIRLSCVAWAIGDQWT